MFGKPKCPKCEGTTFQLAEPFGGIQGSQLKFQFVICTKCSCTITVLSFFDAGQGVQDLKLQVASLTQKLTNISADLGQVSGQVQQVSQQVQRLNK